MAKRFTQTAGRQKSQLTPIMLEDILNKVAPSAVHRDSTAATTRTRICSHLDRPFGPTELNRALKTVANNSPGYDRITYSMLDHLPPAAKG
jgi:hypothetical protein